MYSFRCFVPYIVERILNSFQMWTNWEPYVIFTPISDYDVDYHIGRLVLGFVVGWRLGAVRLE